MSYRVVRAYGDLTVPTDTPLERAWDEWDCGGNGGKWDSLLGACICPPGKTYDSKTGGCKDEVASSSGSGDGSGGGAVTHGEIPEILVTEKEVVSGSTGMSMGLALITGLGLITYGGAIAYLVFGGPKPFREPEFVWEDDEE
jgi:hypothetical protein